MGLNAASQATRHLTRLTSNFQGRGFPSGQDDIHDDLSEDIAISRYSSTSDKIARRSPVFVLCKVSCWREQVFHAEEIPPSFLPLPSFWVTRGGGMDGTHERGNRGTLLRNCNMSPTDYKEVDLFSRIGAFFIQAAFKTSESQPSLIYLKASCVLLPFPLFFWL